MTPDPPAQAFSCGLRHRRESSYLDHAGPPLAGQPKGKVNVMIKAPSLMERQEARAHFSRPSPTPTQLTKRPARPPPAPLPTRSSRAPREP